MANKLARTYLELGDPERAIAAAEPALELYPDQAAPNATLGEAWLRLKDNKKAAAVPRGGELAVSPFDPSVHCGLSEAYRALKDERADAEAGACQSLK